MSKLNIGKYLSASIIFLFIVLSYCIWRDIQIEKQNPGDLRNRIVGARLQMDGKLPYFFKWKSAADYRYYDVHNFDSAKVSNITASPFLHQLLYPIANFKQREISRIWLFIEYLIILLIAVFSYFLLSKTELQKILVISTLIAFLFTIGWISHIYNGQYYLLIPFLSMLFYLSILKNKSYALNVIAGIIAASMLLVRPNILFFFIPFIFIYKQYNLKNLLLIIGVFTFSMCIYFSIPQNRSLWKEYSLALKEETKLHLSLGAAQQVNAISPNYTNYEGWDAAQIKQEELKNPIQPNKEHANVFVLVKSALKYKMPIWLLTILPFVLSLIFCIFFWHQNVRKNNKKINKIQVATFGYCLYMLSDFLSPVHRFPYNFTQWAFPLFLMAANYNVKYWKAYLPILLGLILNIVEIKALRSEHSVGEYLILFGMLAYVMFPKINDDADLHLFN